MDDPLLVLIALCLSGLLLFLYIVLMERKALCSVSCLDSCCNSPHFVYQWTFQPVPPPPPPTTSYVSYSLYYFFLVCRRLSTQFVLI